MMYIKPFIDTHLQVFLHHKGHGFYGKNPPIFLTSSRFKIRTKGSMAPVDKVGGPPPPNSSYNYKVGPLPVISMVISPLIGVITPVTQL